MQAPSIWKTLGMITVKQDYDDVYGMLVDRVEVSPVVSALNGTEIEIEGYFIALSGKTAQSHFMFSLLPQNLCFFCGGAGPETAMEVFMKDNKKVKYSDKKIKLRGTLRVNAKDPHSLLYTLENAVKL